MRGYLFSLAVIGGVVISALIAYAVHELNARGLGKRPDENANNERE